MGFSFLGNRSTVLRYKTFSSWVFVILILLLHGTNFQSDITCAKAFWSRRVFACADWVVLQHLAFGVWQAHARTSIRDHSCCLFLFNTRTHIHVCLYVNKQILWNVLIWLTFACKLFRVHLHAMWKYVGINMCYLHTYSYAELQLGTCSVFNVY